MKQCYCRNEKEKKILEVFFFYFVFVFVLTDQFYLMQQRKGIFSILEDLYFRWSEARARA